jgi:SAM-dependent methyltransferase
MSVSVNENVKRRIPWFVKIPAKIALSRIPVGALLWQNLNLFRAGAMDNPSYAYNTFKKHYSAARRTDLRGCTVLELGPGNSLLTALFARSLAADHTILVDSERLATQDLSIFSQAERMLSDLGLPIFGVSTSPSLDETLNRLNATYLTGGLNSLRSIGDGEVDFLFSNAVLEHIRLAEFAPLLKETRRVLKPGGAASHVIDFRDHLQNGLNHLRFSEKVWESEFMARSGFYTNRLSWPVMQNIFEEAGFAVEACSLERWQAGLPTPQRSMALPFRGRAPEELMTMLAHVVLWPK